MADRRVKVILDGDASPFNRAMLGAAASARAFTQELDTSNDRTTMLTQSLLAIGPSLVPIGAAAVPAIAGLTNQLGFAVAGAGSAALALSGVGDALKAVNDYGIEPTDANLRKLNETMAELGPSGREFVYFLQDLRPKLKELQDVAEAGLLPGLEFGLNDLVSRLPRVEAIVSEVSSAMGDLFAEAGANLADPRWNDFFDFLESEARPTLLAMGRALGNFAEGFANLWMAFAPLSDQFSRSFLQMSRDFAEWTDGLAETEGFQEFLDYVSRVGPKAWDTLGALGNALIQIVEAAAPIGEASLPVIKALANVLATIADSPAGPVLIGAAAGLSALSRAIALYKTANGSEIAKFLGVSGEKGKQAAIGLKAAGAAAGIFALSMTDLDEKAGLSNTASLALLGTMALPGWGTAIGAATGFTLDLANANDDLWSSVNRANLVLGDQSATLGQQDAAIKAAREKVEQLHRSTSAWSDDLDGIKAAKNAFEGLFGKSDVEEADEALRSLEKQRDKNAAAARDQELAEAGLAAGMKYASAETRQETLDLLNNIDAKNKAADAADSIFSAETAYRRALRDATEQARKSNAGIHANTKEADDNRDALERLAGAWNRQADAGGKTESQMRKAQRSFINAAVGMGVARDEAKRLADELFHIPSPKPKVTVQGLDRAYTQIADLKRYLKGIKDEDVIIHVREAIESGGGRGHQLRNANGGYITGPGGPRDDLIPARLSNGEFVVNAAATARHRGLLEEINAQRFAGGGFVQPTGAGSAGSSTATLTIDYDRLAAAVASLPPSKLSIGRREFATVVQDAQNDIARGNR